MKSCRICFQFLRGTRPLHASIVWTAVILSLATGPAAGSDLLYTGVSLAGAEFGSAPTPTDLGTYDDDYIYPNSKEVDYFLSEGMNTLRMPFRWERLQPTLNGDFDSAEFRASIISSHTPPATGRM